MSRTEKVKIAVWIIVMAVATVASIWVKNKGIYLW